MKQNGFNFEGNRLDMVGVAGSIPVAPTIPKLFQKLDQRLTDAVKRHHAAELALKSTVSAHGRCEKGEKFIHFRDGRSTVVDADVHEWASQFNWYVREGYVMRSAGGGKHVRLHREIMKPGPGMVVDHINGDPLDNRRSNLRVCTQANNQWNRRKTKKKTSSRFKGVNRHPGLSKNPWRAAIRVDGKVTHIGLFPTEEDAARAYDAVARKHFGSYACLNFD